MLKDCLAALIAQTCEINWKLEIGVIDNDTSQSARRNVESIAQASSVPVHYAHQPKRGIPFARNAALDLARSRGWSWIALIDDDEVASPDWLAQHIRTASEHQAQVSYGAVVQIHDAPPPVWWKVDTPSLDPEGTVLRRASTNNVLFAASLIADDGNRLRFDEDLLHGYEDLDFFERAHASGNKIVWAPKALVSERVPVSRSQPQRLINMVRSHAAAHAQIDCKRRGFPAAFMKFGLKGLRRIVAGSAISGMSWLLWKAGLPKYESRYYKGRLRLARGVGNWYGLTRVKSGYYDQIDGR